ncbi:MAG: MaoC family dehydratase [Xanthobacteraceae bacterium]
MPFLHPISDRYFEDYVEGDVHRFGTIAVGADEIVAFAKQFDPQTLHTDPEAAKSGPFGGLIASGWHTAGLMTRLFIDHYLTKVASLGSPGGDELRWVKPVRPGDTLSVSVTVLKAIPSKSKPDRGAVTSFVEVINQASEVVMTFKVVNIIAKRSPESRKWECLLLAHSVNSDSYLEWSLSEA